MPLTSFLLRNWPQFAKIFLLIITVLVFAFGWVWFREIPNIQSDMTNERIHATQYPLQMAVSILELYRTRAETGELSLQEAQARALRTLHSSRYGNNQYFWVHNLSLTMLMHPFSPELVGTNIAGYRDSRGMQLFREMNRLLENSPEAVITYTWPRPGTETPESKMSCIRLYQPWGWVIGSGIYLDDVNADISAIKRRVVTSVTTALVLAGLFSLYLIYRINQPLRQTIEFAKRVACGEAIESIQIRPETEGGKVVAVIKGLLADLQAAYQRQKSIIETTNDGFFTITTQGRFLEVNNSFCRLLGYEREELLNMPLEQVEADGSTDETEALIAGIIGQGSDCRETRYRRKDGSTVDVEVSATYAADYGGNLICFARDISEKKRHEAERKLLEAQLLQSQKMEAIGRLAGGVAHEFNNILQVVAGYVMLLQEETGNQTHRGYLGTIEGAVQRASRLTQGMLAYSRQQVFKMIECDVDDTIHHVVPFLERTMGEDIRLELEGGEQPVRCSMDPYQIQQAIINLVTNARDAIDGQGTIHISTRLAETDHNFVQRYNNARIGTFAVIAVSDDGAGFDSGIRDRIFEPFFTTKEVGKGTGLGLSIVYGIVSQHNGFITCDSRPGCGSTFAIYLPLGESSDTGNGLPVPQAAEPGTQRGTILFAEDDTEVQRIMTHLLEKAGYSVLCASDGNEAVALYMAFKSSIDLLLFDAMMPNKNGREAFDEIRAVNKTVPACFISGYACETLKEELARSGAAFISKPANHQLLLSTISELLHRQRGEGCGMTHAAGRATEPGICPVAT